MKEKKLQNTIKGTKLSIRRLLSSEKITDFLVSNGQGEITLRRTINCINIFTPFEKNIS
jgi:hypothetical protein